MYSGIEEYGIIGNLHSVALVGLNGSIDWLCLPHIDSPSIFGALLDGRRGGRFSISPLDEWDSAAEYLSQTNVLITRFRTRKGMAVLTDFMPVAAGGEETQEAERHDLYRMIEITRGTMSVEVLFEPRFSYGRVVPILEVEGNCVVARSEAEKLVLSATRPLRLDEGRSRSEWLLSEGDRIWFRISYRCPEDEELEIPVAERALEETIQYWRRWLRESEAGCSFDLGPYREMAERSALVLKLLYYEPTGTIAAAATTSLPEEIGGERNWDYRYTWIRDAAFTLQALFDMGHLSETEGYLRWLESLLSRCGAGRMRIMYGLRGEEDLPEVELVHLDGYKGSRPVRIGNGAAGQRQLDIYGELLESALKLSGYVGKIDPEIWPFLRNICDYVAGHWQEEGMGIWEVRNGPSHFVYSRVMCWVALDRGIEIARRYGFPADRDGWSEARRQIREEVLLRGWSEKRRAFVQRYDAEELDASLLLLPLMGFLPFDDERIVSTIEAIRTELGENGFLLRYRGNDGLRGGEGAFLLCSFWLVSCLVEIKKLEEAEDILRRLSGCANHLGLFSEEYDPYWREALGNFPQALSHIGYINGVIALQRAKQAEGDERQPERGPGRVARLLSRKIILNEGEPREEVPAWAMAVRLKLAMNRLRGGFFDVRRGRVAYERMRNSECYGAYLALSRELQRMDLQELKGREERLAFWINLYNVMVIHAVIELEVSNSVKDVRNFFRRVYYQIGSMSFSLDDIEHGILRDNSRPANSFFRSFTRDDERERYRISPMDPRIHFALVCASSSCPPIEVYSAGILDSELFVAGQSFLNGGGLILDKKGEEIRLSRIFKWYGGDFGSSLPEILCFLADFLYDEDDADYLRKKSERLSVSFMDYDWRLNRY